jgi:glycosyltransferase involved in cell wall biosynthesis
MVAHDTSSPPATAPKPLGSVVIPAHNESAVIERCLDALFSGIPPGELEVIVVCNGCTDDTAGRARALPYPVRVLELDRADKAAALRAGDAAALVLPRLYLDADVVLPGESARRVLARLADGAIAARPPLSYDSSRSSPIVRSYYRARSRLPAVLGGLWGAGVYGLSAAGRSRFDEFPDVVADDLWLDHQFAGQGIEIVDCPPVVVMVPRRARDLLRILRRANRGKDRASLPDGAQKRSRMTTRATLADLRRLAASGPIAALDAATYAGFATGVRFVRAVAPTSGRLGTARWERDSSSRS